MGLAGYIESPDSSFFLWKNAYQDYHKTSTVPFSFQNWVENTFWENIAQRTGLLKLRYMDAEPQFEGCGQVSWLMMMPPSAVVWRSGELQFMFQTGLWLHMGAQLPRWSFLSRWTWDRMSHRKAFQEPCWHKLQPGSQLSARHHTGTPVVTRVGFILPYSRVSFLTTQSEKLHSHSTQPFRRWLIVWKMWAV